MRRPLTAALLAGAVCVLSCKRVDPTEQRIDPRVSGLVEAVLFRQHLCRVPKPTAQQTFQKPWWRRLFGS